MGRMTIVKSSRVPCGFLLCQVWGDPLDWQWDEYDDALTVPIQTDWDFPGVASCWGWKPCECGETDGTVDCKHKTASEMIADARQFIEDECLEVVVFDPGHFSDLPEGYEHVWQ